MSSKIETLRVSDLVESASIYSPFVTASQLAGHLQNTNGYEGFVEENGRVGIVSLRELLNAVEDIGSTRLSKIMLPAPGVSYDDPVSPACQFMLDQRIRALPVYHDGKLEGKITSVAVSKAYLENSKPKKVLRDIMTLDPVMLKESDTVAKARDLMLRRRFDQLPIADASGKKLEGVVTIQSIVFSALRSAGHTRDEKGGRVLDGRLHNTALSIADTSMTTSDVNDSIEVTFQKMLDSSTNYSVVISNDSVVGIVTLRDFLKLLPLPPLVRNVNSSPVSILGLPDNPLEADMLNSKFAAAVEILQRKVPGVSEARAVIKNKEVNSSTLLYQVQVFIDAGGWHENYKTEGYDLSSQFAAIDKWIRRIATEHSEKKRSSKRVSRRK